ncbi:MAG: low specificity L-threonine aldolase [Gammaproteobacteria bacterium]|nr:low specificity L-threonine aldolase [Gammaproteobacteria bacterium]
MLQRYKIKRPGPFKTRQFASDNCSGICPEAFVAMEQANTGHAAAYGEDEWTAQAADMLRDFFDTDCEVFFTFNGTSANAITLSSMCRSYHAVLTSDVSHIESNECGAPEFFSHGSKLLLIDSRQGKVTPDGIHAYAGRPENIHFPKPHVVSLTQPTEFGTIYTVDELKAINDVCEQYQLKTHMDGARFANALVALDTHPAEITWKAGVDVLCFGGTKNGLAVGEAIVFFNMELAREFDYHCKQAGELASKMRFITAPWIGMLQDNAMHRYAAHANEMARYLADRLTAIPGVELLFPVETNAVYIALSQEQEKAMHEHGWHFHIFDKAGARFMCSWDTGHEEIDAFAADLAEVLGR